AAAVAGDAAAVFGKSQVVFRVQPPSVDEINALQNGTVLLGYLAPYSSKERIAALKAKNITSFAVELIPRISRAQSMDALSSQAVANADVLITTAAIPGKRSPLIITETMITGMKNGAVVVDMAAEGGGNCAGTQAGQTVKVGGATIIGPVNLPAQMPVHASEMY